ncbi:hypothetical protein CAPTEDRAFT_219799 [Capitella teleta]|uniref:Non-homologous end-joining factor 1 n=1 Tax=Capitella teleta TaxID=283909 RepID=R7TL86_CAPTE|nr:hypothetical protein CAPTEDRAFT_219799 [Capitella teleta]|eukprot:ELT91860.1 hypothetical protein CAPTEDRAFT_219799 [Capitella teleta]
MHREVETEWRRTWEPCISTTSWRQLHAPIEPPSSHSLHIKSLFRNDEYYIMFTDFKSIWTEALSPTEVKKRCQELNPSIEAPLSKILDVLKDGLSDEDHGDLRCTRVESCLKVQLTTKLAGIPFSWTLNCERVDDEEFESVVSSNLCPFSASQNLYFDVMMKKQFLNDMTSRKIDDASDEDSVVPRAAISSWSQRVPASLANQNAATVSPSKSPVKKSTPEKNEDNELIRRRELEKRLREEEERKDKGKKKKKIKF